MGREMEGRLKREYIYTYDWFMLRFDRKQQNSVKQLFFNNFFFFFLEKNSFLNFTGKILKWNSG